MSPYLQKNFELQFTSKSTICDLIAIGHRCCNHMQWPSIIIKRVSLSLWKHCKCDCKVGMQTVLEVFHEVQLPQ